MGAKRSLVSLLLAGAMALGPSMNSLRADDSTELIGQPPSDSLQEPSGLIFKPKTPASVGVKEWKLNIQDNSGIVLKTSNGISILPESSSLGKENQISDKELDQYRTENQKIIDESLEKKLGLKVKPNAPLLPNLTGISYDEDGNMVPSNYKSVLLPTPYKFQIDDELSKRDLKDVHGDSWIVAALGATALGAGVYYSNQNLSEKERAWANTGMFVGGTAIGVQGVIHFDKYVVLRLKVLGTNLTTFLGPSIAVNKYNQRVVEITQKKSEVEKQKVEEERQKIIQADRKSKENIYALLEFEKGVIEAVSRGEHSPYFTKIQKGSLEKLLDELNDLEQKGPVISKKEFSKNANALTSQISNQIDSCNVQFAAYEKRKQKLNTILKEYDDQTCVGRSSIDPDLSGELGVATDTGNFKPFDKLYSQKKQELSGIVDSLAQRHKPFDIFQNQFDALRDSGRFDQDDYESYMSSLNSLRSKGVCGDDGELRQALSDTDNLYWEFKKTVYKTTLNHYIAGNESNTPTKTNLTQKTFNEKWERDKKGYSLVLDFKVEKEHASGNVTETHDWHYLQYNVVSQRWNVERIEPGNRSSYSSAQLDKDIAELGKAMVELGDAAYDSFTGAVRDLGKAWRNE